MKDLLRDLVETPGVTGDEGRIRSKIRGYLENDVDAVYEDDFGNLITRKGEGEKTLMLVAHMDQIGFRTKYVDDDGYATVSATGGINDETVAGQRLRFYNSDDFVGVLGATPPHLSKDGDSTEVKDLIDRYVDLGAADRDDAWRNMVDIGSYAVYDTEFEELMGDYVAGPALDNRTGCAVAIEAMKRFGQDNDPGYELVTVFTREEEVGLKGAKTAANHIDPDAALAIDTAVAGDVPDIEPKKGTHIETEQGPVITLQEANGRGLITHPHIEDWLVFTAESYGLPYQKEVGEGGATDAAAIYTVLDGIPSGSIGIPTRHLHSPNEVTSMRDVEGAVDYLEALLDTFPSHA